MDFSVAESQYVNDEQVSQEDVLMDTTQQSTASEDATQMSAPGISQSITRKRKRRAE